VSADRQNFGGGYVFEGGFPTPEAVQRAYDDADLNRAIQAYRFFFPTVSGLAIYRGSEAVGLIANTVLGMLDTEPEHVGFTLNSDTPFGPMILDLRDGPMVIEMPPGPLICVLLDLNQRWVADMALPGPDGGKGGTHLVLPPDWDGEVPDGYFVSRSTSYRVIGGLRSLPVDGDVQGAKDRLQTIKVRPLNLADASKETTWVDLTPKPMDTTPLAFETGLGYWRALHEVIESEPHFDGYGALYGELAALGIAKGTPFAPDQRMTKILEQASEIGNAQMRVQSFADRRLDRKVWDGTYWEWAALRFENGNFYTDSYLDIEAREKWFFQAVAASPAMFRRSVGAGSLYWLGLREKSGAYLNGSNAYTLTVPQPVPAKLFWSITVYDAETRSQIRTDQNKAALRSVFELAHLETSQPVVLHFAPDPPADDEAKRRWIKTIPGKGWFVYFRIYGPEGSAFDAGWQLPDFQQAT
jgi:hypothetical protein